MGAQVHADDIDKPVEGSAHRAEAEALRELLGVAAHDLSNPLQSLSVLLELALDELEPSSPIADKLESSLTAAEQLRGLIRGLAEFSRGEPGAMSRRTVGRVINACLGVCERRFERQRIALHRDTDAVEGLAPADPRLKGALLNLLLGCIQAAGRSGMSQHALSITAGGSNAAGRLFVTLHGEAGEPLALDDRYVVRAELACAGNSVGLHLERPGDGRFVLHLTPAPPASPESES